MKKNNIFILGGNSLAAQYCDNKNYNIKFYRRNKDRTKKILLTKKYIIEAIKKFQPVFIINLIANTDINFCENNKNISYKDNFLTNKIVTDVCKLRNIPLIYFSSDQIFDGKSNCYYENSKPRPLNIYAKHKLNSEMYIIRNLKKYLIIRTNFFANSPKSKFIQFIKDNKIINGFDDVFFNPLHIKNIWKIIYFLIETKKNGIFNLSSNNRISKYKFIQKVNKKLKLNNKIIKDKLKNKKIQKLVKRPMNMFLSNKKIKKIYKNKEIFVLKNNLKIL